MGIRVKGIADVDGSTVELDFSDANIRRISSWHKYTYSGTKAPPPASGQVVSDGTDQSDNTIFWVHRLDGNGEDLKFLFMQVKKDDQLYAQELANSDTHELYTLTEDPIDGGDYITFHVKPAIASREGRMVPGGAILLGVSV